VFFHFILVCMLHSLPVLFYSERKLDTVFKWFGCLTFESFGRREILASLSTKRCLLINYLLLEKSMSHIR